MAVSIFAIHLLGDAISPPIIGRLADVSGLARAVLIVPAAIALSALGWIATAGFTRINVRWFSEQSATHSTVATPASIAALTARSFGIIPPLTNSSWSSRSGLSATANDSAVPVLHALDSVRNTNSFDRRAIATAAAVSSPLTLSSDSFADRQRWDDRHVAGIEYRGECSAFALTFVPTRPQGPFFVAWTTPKMPTAGTPCREVH